MTVSRSRRLLARIMATLLIVAGTWSTAANAAMISTSTAAHQERVIYDREQLLQALESAELQKQLVDLGVDPQEAKDRVANLTAAELQQLNQHLAEQPAGGLLGVVLALFVLFVITDMLCATDLFTFVRCINK